MEFFNLHKTDDGIITLTFDTPKSNVNLFSKASMQEMDTIIETLSEDETIKALFIESAKTDIYIAGADINEIKTADNEKDIYNFVKQGQDLFNKLEKLPFATIALIDGVCLGGGLEMSLACDYRLATSDAHTKIGLVEVNLGIIPGFGGTQRLPSLTGYAKAMELIIGAKQLNGEKALKLGVVDACVPSGYLQFKKEEFIKDILANRLDAKIKRNRKGVKWYEHFKGVREFIGSITRKKVLQKTGGHYPAPLKVIDVMQSSFELSLEEGLKIEREVEVSLALSDVSKNLIGLFLTSEALKHDSFSTAKAQNIHYSAVVGAGVMGSEIAWALNSKDIEVRLKVRHFESAAKTIQVVKKIYNTIVKRNRLTPREVALKMDRISFTTEYLGFAHMDFLIEAVNEDEALKQGVYKEFEAVLPKSTIIATNTSSISISQLANQLEHPERFIGMHFFNPVHRMPLVEIIAGEKTDETTVATVVSLAKRMGKTPIKIKDSAGFLVNRILLPYLQEAVFMFEDGEKIDKIDRVLLEFGMPMGPFTLIDTVGVDIGANVSEILHNAYGERMALSKLMSEMVAQNWLGKKTKKGFYDYSSKEPKLNNEIYNFQKAQTTLQEAEIVERALLMMINEAAKCLEEDVVENPKYLDMAMVMGTGFPAFRGGLLRYADRLGAASIVNRLKQLHQQFGERFHPAALLQQMAKESKSFYGGAL